MKPRWDLCILPEEFQGRVWGIILTCPMHPSPLRELLFSLSCPSSPPSGEVDNLTALERQSSLPPRVDEREKWENAPEVQIYRRLYTFYERFLLSSFISGLILSLPAAQFSLVLWGISLIAKGPSPLRTTPPWPVLQWSSATSTWWAVQWDTWAWWTFLKRFRLLSSPTKQGQSLHLVQIYCLTSKEPSIHTDETNEQTNEWKRCAVSISPCCLSKMLNL